MTPKKNRQFLPLFLILISLFVILGVLSAVFPYFSLDLTITRQIQSIHSTSFSSFMWAISVIGNQPVIISLVTIATVVLYLSSLKKEALFSSLSAGIAALVGATVKILVNRPRPTPDLVHVSVWLSDKSFPSGHVLVFTTYFGFLLYLLLTEPKHKSKGIILSIVMALLITSIGVSRIFLGAHWASDVLGGYLLGTIWLILTIRLYNSYHGQR